MAVTKEGSWLAVEPCQTGESSLVDIEKGGDTVDRWASVWVRQRGAKMIVPLTKQQLLGLIKKKKVLKKKKKKEKEESGFHFLLR